MIQVFLEKLNELVDKRSSIELNTGQNIICIPSQYLQEDYESFLIKVLESTGEYSAGDLVELEEYQIKSVIAM